MNHHDTPAPATMPDPTPFKDCFIEHTRSPRNIEVTFDAATGSETWRDATALEMAIPTALGLGHLWEFGHLAVVARDENSEPIPFRLRITPAAA